MHRSFHAMDFLKTSTDVPTGMEFGTFRTLEALQKKYGDLILCFDNYKRKDKGEFYKANRTKKPDSFYERLERLSRAIRHEYHYAQVQGWEADEVICALVPTFDNCFIYSNDRDMYQLLSEECKVIRSHRGKEWVFDKEDMWEKFHLKPHQWAVYKSLMGDKSDNIPKCKGIGAEWGAELVRKAEYVNPKHFAIDPCMMLAKVLDFANLSKNQRKTWEKFKAQLCVNYELIFLRGSNVKVQPPVEGDMEGYKKELEFTCDETEF